MSSRRRRRLHLSAPHRCGALPEGNSDVFSSISGLLGPIADGGTLNPRAEPSLLQAAATEDAQVIGEAVSAWVEAHVPPTWLEAALAGDMALLHTVRSAEDYRAWYPVLGGSGLIGPSWPVEVGGLG